ncbi:MAG: hypothetical protein K8L97_12895 [Anaerolineae bacterium]|nr:hypothetical protein [Anaerolineae bacterium]
MNDILKGVDRNAIIKGLALYLLIYALVNVCGGILFTFVGALSGAATALGSVAISSGAAAGVEGTQEGAQAIGELAGVTAGVLVLGCISLLSVPLFAVAAWGLYNYKKWSRMATVIALIVSIVLSLLSLSNGIGGILWIAISAFGIYLFWTDAEIQALLSK